MTGGGTHNHHRNNPAATWNEPLHDHGWHSVDDALTVMLTKKRRQPRPSPLAQCSWLHTWWPKTPCDLILHIAWVGWRYCVCAKRVEMSWYESDLSSNHVTIYRVVGDKNWIFREKSDFLESSRSKMASFQFKRSNFNLNGPIKRWHLTTAHQTQRRAVAPDPTPTQPLPSAPVRRQPWRSLSPPRRPEHAVAPRELALVPQGGCYCDRTTSKIRDLSPKIISGDSRWSKNAKIHTSKHTILYMKFKLKLL
jgi:hypothetical protein